MRAFRRICLGLSLVTVGALVACTLNPQPLPPSADSAETDAGNFGSPPEADGSLAAAPQATPDDGGTTLDSGPKGPDVGGLDAGDAGDADAGDAG